MSASVASVPLSCPVADTPPREAPAIHQAPRTAPPLASPLPPAQPIAPKVLDMPPVLFPVPVRFHEWIEGVVCSCHQVGALALLLVTLLGTGCMAELPKEKSYTRTNEWLTVVLWGPHPTPLAQAAWQQRAGKLAEGLHLGTCTDPGPNEWQVSAEIPAPAPPPKEGEPAGPAGSTTIAAPLRCKAGAL